MTLKGNQTKSRPGARQRSWRNANGSSISEFGPAIGLLLICFFFPLIDLLAIVISYGLCMVLNTNQVHEASLIPRSAATDPNGTVIKTIPDTWLSGMGHFVKITGSPQTELTYRQGTQGDDQVTDMIVMVKTTVLCNPFLPIPIPAFNVPGINGPMTFTVSAERTMENPDYGNP